MSTVTKIRKVGNSSAVILPKELLGRLRVEQGDEVNLIPIEDGIKITSYDENISRQMELAAKVMKENRQMLKKLAE